MITALFPFSCRRTCTFKYYLGLQPPPNCSLGEGTVTVATDDMEAASTFCRQESYIKAICKVTQLVIKKYVFIIVLRICILQKARVFFSVATELLGYLTINDVCKRKTPKYFSHQLNKFKYFCQ